MAIGVPADLHITLPGVVAGTVFQALDPSERAGLLLAARHAITSALNAAALPVRA